jgi:hypothetical protein
MKKLLLLVFSILTVISYIVGYVIHLSASPEPEGRVVWELSRDRDYQGQIQRGAVDAQGRITYLATRATLYEVQNDKRIRIIAQYPKEEMEAKLAIAPGGGVYAWLIPQPSWKGLFLVKLFNLSGKQMAELSLKNKNPPYGFGAFYLGFQGKLIVTATPLDDWEGIRGRFQFTFWNHLGRILNSLVLGGRHMAILDPSGEAILLLGDKEAIAFSPEGKELWRYPGKFRKASIAKSGSIALLNPSSPEEIKQVQIFMSSQEPVKIQLPTPVHGLTLAADGSSAVVIGDQGRYFYLDLPAGKWREGKRLPFDGTFYIFNSKFVNSKTLALGVQHRTSKATWEKATIIIIDQNGDPLFQKEFPLREATSFIPGIDVTLGSRFIVGFAEDTAILIELKE